MSSVGLGRTSSTFDLSCTVHANEPRKDTMMISDPLLLHVMRSLADNAHASITGDAAARGAPDRRWFTVESLFRAAVDAGRAHLRHVARARTDLKTVHMPNCDCAA
jgi:hypothetical protein